MGKPHSFRKYKKALKNCNRHIWYAPGQKQTWPGNFHPRQAFNMLCLRPFYIPDKGSARIASILDLTEAQFNTFAKPFLGVSYANFRTMIAAQRR